MVRPGSVGVVAAMAVLAVACGSVHPVFGVPATASSVRTTSPPRSYPSTAFPSPSFSAPTTASTARTQCPAVQTAPQFPASTPSNRNLAIVWLRGSYQYVVRDITDISQPTTVATFADLGSPQFVSATDVSGFGNK